MTVITISAKLFGFLALGSVHFTLPFSIPQSYAWRAMLGGVVEISATATPSIIAASRSVVMQEVLATDRDILDMHEPVNDRLKEFMDNTTFS